MSRDLQDMFKFYDEVKDDLKFFVSSEVRAKILIILSEGSKDLAGLKKEIHLSSSTILHGMYQLEQKDIIVRKSGNYSLSQTGEIIADKLIDMIRALYALNKCENLFLNHEIGSIPPELLKDVGCLKNALIVRSTSTDIMRPYNVLSEFLSGSRNVKHLSSVFFMPNVKKLLENPDRNGMVHLLLTEEILNKLLEVVDQESIDEGLSSGNFKLGIIEDDTRISFTQGDNFMALGLFTDDGAYDLNISLISECEDAIDWGERLFNYHLNLSTEFRL